MEDRVSSGISAVLVRIQTRFLFGSPMTAYSVAGGEAQLSTGNLAEQEKASFRIENEEDGLADRSHHRAGLSSSS